MDEILHITLEGGAARAMVAVTTGLVEKARQTHGLSAVASAALGRTLTAGAILGATTKNPTDNRTVSIRGGGPIGPVVCVAHADGAVKGYVGDPQLELPPKPNGKLDVGGAVGSHPGTSPSVRDLGLRDPYVGQTRMVSGEIAEDLAFYLTVSEQTPSLVALGVMVQGGHIRGAGGVLVQPMPDCPEDVMEKLEALAPKLTAVSTMAHDCKTARELAEKALDGVSYEILGSSQPRYQSRLLPRAHRAGRCSRWAKRS